MTITAPEDVANLVMAKMEHLRVLLLNIKHRVLRIHEAYVSTVGSSAVRAEEVFRPAIRQNTLAMVLVHNHPSGDPTPSEPDAAVTRDLVSAGKLLEIDLLDHPVIGDDGRWVNLNTKGIGFQ